MDSLASGMAVRLLAVCLMALAAASIRAETLRVVTPAPPGTNADVMSRLLGEHMSRSLGRTLIVENKPGASGILATEAVLAAPANGGTLYFAGLDHIVWGPAALGRRPWDPLTDLAFIGFANADRWVILANPATTGGDLRAAQDLGRTREVRCANQGLGTTQHALCGWFAKAVGIPVLHVPYTRPFLNDLMSGIVDLAAVPAPTAVPHLRSGRLKALAILSAERHPSLPDVPSVVELGHPDLVFEAGLGIYTVAATPVAVLDRLTAALQAAQGDSELARRFAELGVDTIVTSREDAVLLLEKRLAAGNRVRAAAFATPRP